MSSPNQALAIKRYRHHAAGYDATTHRMEPVRMRAIRHLALRPGNAVLFNYTHDVLQSATALANIFAHVRLGGRVVSAGMKLFPWWLAPLNIVALAKAYPYTTTLSGLGRPWHMLEGRVADLDVESMFGGIAYVARGRFAPDWSKEFDLLFGDAAPQLPSA